MKSKLIDILREVLDEAKQVGKIYHFTTYKGMNGIIGDGFKLKSNDHYEKNGDKYSKIDTKYISFTRNKNMPGSTTTSISDEVRITIDGDRMSDKYKFEPYADSKSGYGRGDGSGGTDKYDESEERVKIDTKKYSGGIDISRYVVTVDIMSPMPKNDDYDEETPRPKSLLDFKELINQLKKKNIDFKIVESFK